MSSTDGAPKGSVPDGIIETLRQRILRGEVAAGERLPPERELAKHFGTNRTSLREALRALQAQGLVKARQGDGVRVQDFRRWGDISLLPHYFAAVNPAERLEIITQMMRLRALLVPEILGLALDRIGPTQLDELRSLHKALATATADQNMGEVASTELGLYRVLVEASQSLTYVWVFNSLEKVVRGFIDAQPEMWILIPGLVELWRDIVEAICSLDRASAEQAFARLLETIEGQVRQLYALIREATAGSG
jgi:GntR family transcriptional regulator, transcriptional repressor for pyruvate dehydrogenase complex